MKSSILAISVAVVVAASGTAGAVEYGDNLFLDVADYGVTDTFNVFDSNVQATSAYTAPLGTTGADDLIGTLVPVTDTSTAGQVNALLLEEAGLGNTAGLLTDYNILFSYTLSGKATFIDGSALVPDGTLDYYTVCDGAGSPSGGCTAAGEILVGSDGIIDGSLELTNHGLDAIDPTFDSGKITLTFEDVTGTILGAGNTVKLVELDLDAFTASGPDVVLYTSAEYSWYKDNIGDFSATEQDLIENFFNFVTALDIGGTGYNSWYDIWANGTDVGLPILLAQRSDFNVDPDKVPQCTTGDCTTLTRSTNLNITTEARVEAQLVPEPGLLALMSVGMLVVGVAGRRSRRAKKA